MSALANEPLLHCRLCGEPETPMRAILIAGRVPVCRDCDQKFRSVFRQHLEPVAAAKRIPVDQLMCTVAYDFADGHWHVHLFTMKPGLVIGTAGETVDPIRESLVALTGDDRLRLNLRQLQDAPSA